MRLAGLHHARRKRAGGHVEPRACARPGAASRASDERSGRASCAEARARAAAEQHTFVEPVGLAVLRSGAFAEPIAAAATTADELDGTPV